MKSGKKQLIYLNILETHIIDLSFLKDLREIIAQVEKPCSV